MMIDNSTPAFALRSRRVILPHGMCAATVKIQAGKIAAIQSYTDAPDCPLEDVGNKVIMPGLVDTHVHINEPGRTDWEGFSSATRAAAAGGITTLVDMPLNCIPVTTTRMALAEKLQALENKLSVDCGFWGGVIPANIDDLDELLSAGVLGVKSFLIDSGIDEFPAITEADIRRALPILSHHNVPYLIHAELDLAARQPEPIGSSYRKFLASRPDCWETDAVDLMIKLGKETAAKDQPCKIHIVHLSSAQAIENIRQARADGLTITAETCPHYLCLAAEGIADGKTLFKCCPPIRNEANREHLWAAIKTGVIDFIVSDHSPCTPQLKLQESGDLEHAWGGISALQFGFSLIWTEARKRGFSLAEVSRLMSSKPAAFAGLESCKGQIKAGLDADLVIFDDQTSYTIRTDMIKHKHKITPFIDTRVEGRIETTYLRGRKIFDQGEFQAGHFGKTLLKSDGEITYGQ